MKLIILASLVLATHATTPTNCLDGPDNGCDIGGQCMATATVGVSRCVCYQGYQLSLITSKCIDVNECLSTTSALCQYGICRNLVGSYRCRCFQQYGFVVSPDGKACIKPYQVQPWYQRYFMLSMLGGGL